MHMGHLDQQRSNVRSTQPHPNPSRIELTSEDILDQQQDAAQPIIDPPSQKSHYIYVHCQESTGQLYTDPTGRFQEPSTSGNTTVLIAYEYDTDYVHAEPIRSKSGPQILAEYKRVHKMLTARGLKKKITKARQRSLASTALYRVGN
jgi:hypothetical protein